MKPWHAMLLLGALALGCGGTPSEEGWQADEPGASTALGWSPAPGSARLVKDIFPPVSGPPWWGPYPESLVAFRGKLFFAANFEDGRRELWKSDGTPEGTVPVKQFPAHPASASLSNLTVVGSRLFFVVSDETHGSELWVTNGTEAGTHRVKDLTPGSSFWGPDRLTAVGGRLLFFRYLPETPTTPARRELWRSNGTEAGTVLVSDLGPDTSLYVSSVVVKDTLYFVLSNMAHGTELWKTDGTAAGTGLVKDIHPGSGSAFPSDLRVLGERVFFTAWDPTHGQAVWRTDGTEAGTQRVVDLVPGPDHSLTQVLGVIGHSLYFALREVSGPMRLYRLKDGDAGVSVKLVATLPSPSEEQTLYITTFASSGGKLYFALALYGWGPAPTHEQLWVSDGTSSGTKMLHPEMSRYDEFGSSIFRVADRVLFTGHEDATGLDLWMSDGTPGGTQLVQDISPSHGTSFARNFIQVGLQVFFIAHDGAHGSELWVLPLQETNTHAAE
jgi:ELWxxDGT repeat protein